MSTLAPRLRFKEFNGSMISNPIASIAKVYDGTHQTPKYVDSGVPFFSVEHVTRDQFTKTKFISEDVFEKECKRVRLEKGDILMSRIGDVGSVKYIHWDVKASFYVSLALFKSLEFIKSNYLAHNMSAIPFQRELWSRMIHVAFPKKINLGEISKCVVNYPKCIDEQQKIADFLSSVDTKISQLTEKHRLLKGYKKGVRQQIFSQRVRFKDDDGNVLPEWSYKKLSKITSKVGSGSTPRGGQEAYTSNGVIFIRSQNVYDNKLDLRKTVFISQSTHTKMKGSKVQKHDVLLNITGASIGRSCVVPKKFEEGNVNQHVCIIRTNNELDPYYLQFFLSSYLGQKIIFQSQAGGGREGLNFESIKLFKIPLPSVKEQQKIAQFLQSLDKKIDAVNDQIEQTKLFKKGLLQQMFV